jgi:hypothetical protein
MHFVSGISVILHTDVGYQIWPSNLTFMHVTGHWFFELKFKFTPCVPYYPIFRKFLQYTNCEALLTSKTLIDNAFWYTKQNTKCVNSDLLTAVIIPFINFQRRSSGLLPWRPWFNSITVHILQSFSHQSQPLLFNVKTTLHVSAYMQAIIKSFNTNLQVME